MVDETQSPPPETGPIDRAVVDVRKFADQLPDKYRKLAKSARQWISRHSCDADIGVAHTYIEDAFRLHATGRDSLRHATAALLQSAVIHYARAFDPATKHRSYLDIKPKLDEDSQDLHSLLIDLRHESLAHFGPAGDDFNPWSEDIPAIIIERGTWQTMVASKRALFRKGLAQKFRDHIAIVWPIVSSISQKNKETFEAALREAWEADDEIENLLASCQLDPAILGGWNGPFLGGPRKGRSLQILFDNDFK